MKQPNSFLYRSHSGSVFGLLFFFILLIFLLILADIGYIFASEECMGLDAGDCFAEIFSSDDEEGEKPEGSVTATGMISGTYGKSERSVTVSLTFPLAGGDVTGSFEGDCDGSIKGSFSGGNGGTISGKAKGSCGFILPASGQFSGTVNTAAKTVPIRGNGSAAGFSGEGSVTLSY